MLIKLRLILLKAPLKQLLNIRSLIMRKQKLMQKYTNPVLDLAKDGLSLDGITFALNLSYHLTKAILKKYHISYQRKYN